MNALGFALFDSPIGTCGIAWSGYGIFLQMLESRSALTVLPTRLFSMTDSTTVLVVFFSGVCLLFNLRQR